MPADDHPFDALKRHYELEDSSRSPITQLTLEIGSRLPLGWPFDTAFAKLKEHLASDSLERVEIMLETCMSQVRKIEDEIDVLKRTLTAEESQRRADAARDLLVDATRRAVNTRD